MSEPFRPLAGRRVLDFSRLLPGPMCSLLLADLGADVVKVEEPGGGDYARWYPPMVPVETGEYGAAFAALNRDKRSVAVNLKSDDGKAVVKALARSADVVLESFRPGVLDRLRLGYAALAEVNPRLVFCAISGYGATGPYKLRAGHDINYAALAGLLALNGPRDGTPVVYGAQLGDVGGGSYAAALAIVAALLDADKTGQGRFLDVSMTDGARSFLTMLLGKVAAGAEHTTRGRDELAGGLPCYGVYPTKDGGAMALGALEPKFWQGFCAAVGRPDLAGEGHVLAEGGDQTRAELSALFRTKTRAEWTALFAEHDVCCEPVLEPHELLGHPLHEARGAFTDVGGLRLPTTPFSAGEPTRAPAPALGADTRALLREAGYDDARIDALAAAGAIALGGGGAS